MAAPPHSNVFTRNLLALYGAMPWRGVPVMPVEIMLLPRWFPFHLDKVSYWARTVLVPLIVLKALKPRARNPKGVRHRRAVRHAAGGGAPLAQGPASDWPWSQIFGAIDRVLARGRALFPEGDARARHRQAPSPSSPSG